MPPWKGVEKDITSTCTSTSVSRSDTRGAPWQEATRSSSLYGASNTASITLSSPRQAPPPRRCQTMKQATKTSSPVTTTATIRGPRRPDRSFLEPELSVMRAHFGKSRAGPTGPSSASAMSNRYLGVCGSARSASTAVAIPPLHQGRSIHQSFGLCAVIGG